MIEPQRKFVKHAEDDLIRLGMTREALDRIFERKSIDSIPGAIAEWGRRLSQLRAAEEAALRELRSIKEHDVVVLSACEEGEAVGLAAGSKGTVVHLYDDGLACEVEFSGCKLVALPMNVLKKETQ